MSRTVKIPDNLQPWECEINGVKYGPYPAGSIQTVPDEVGSVIDAYNSSLPVENPPETLEEEIRRIVDEEGGSVEPLVLNLVRDEEAVGVAYTSGHTVGEIKDAIDSGKRVRIVWKNDAGTCEGEVIKCYTNDDVGNHPITLEAQSIMTYFDLVMVPFKFWLHQISTSQDEWRISGEAFVVNLTMESETTAMSNHDSEIICNALEFGMPVQVEVNTGTYTLKAQGVQRVDIPGVGTQLLVQAIDILNSLLYVFYCTDTGGGTSIWNLIVFTLTPAT